MSAVFLMLLCLPAHSQEAFYNAGLPRLGFERDYMTVFGGYSAGSTMLTNSFMNRFYKGGFIDNDLKAEARERQNQYNYLGGSAEAGYAWHWRTGWGKKRTDTIVEILLYIPNKTPRRYQQHNVTYRERFLLNAGFSTDAFRMVFEGNRPFYGDTIDLNKTRFTSLRFQELHYGIDFYNDRWPVSFGVGVSLLNGQNFAQVNLKDGYVFTDPLLSFINVRANALWQQSDTAQTGWGVTNGLGASLTLKLNYQFQDVFKVETQLTDLGAIRWNDKSMTYQRDTLINFTGIDISNAIIDPESVDGLPEVDSLTGLAQKGGITTWIPAAYMVRVSSVMKNYHSLQWGWTMQGWTTTGWYSDKPSAQHTLWGAYQMGARLRAQGGVAFGGFARFQTPAEVALSFKHVHLQAGTPNLLAWVAPGKTTGQGFWISLGYQFGNH
ncbi:MAG: DUF5723 family protein [Bacteroidia bacterium]|nr:DUF5723 family protein [Bacteroidia bacterium]